MPNPRDRMRAQERQHAELAALITNDPLAVWCEPDRDKWTLWSTARTVFLDAEIDPATVRRDGTFPGYEYIYDDRLANPRFMPGATDVPTNDQERADALFNQHFGAALRMPLARQAVEKIAWPSANYYSVFLSSLWAREVRVCHAMVGLRPSHYPFYVFGWRLAG